MSKSHTNEKYKIILFDGVCKLCNGWAKFLIKHDHKRSIKLATVQSTAGQALLKRHGLPLDHYDTMVYLEGSAIYTQSSAFLKVMRVLPLPWPLLFVFWIIPKFLRDWLYDRIALNRYKLFGKYDTCLLPNKDHDERFLSDN